MRNIGRMLEEIQSKLQSVEKEHGVRVLYACESGSRAWGFASPDSDYDVRFIYVHPREWYLGIHQGKDSIDLKLDENELDFSGWDLRKALALFQRSNSALIEWMHSPIVYFSDDPVMNRWRGLLEQYFDPKGAASHYLGHCKSFWLGGLESAEEVSAKKYLYTLRTLFAARWILEEGGNPPVRFEDLFRNSGVDGQVVDEIDRLIAKKGNLGEAETLPRSQVLHRFIQGERIRLEDRVADVEERHRGVEALDQFFLEVIGESNFG